MSVITPDFRTAASAARRRRRQLLAGRARPAALAFSLLIWLAGCMSFNSPPPQLVPVYKSETFDTESQYIRRFEARAPLTCEAVRRALLSQGYVVTRASADHVTGRKHFQPEREIHQEIEFNVVCASEGPADGPSVLFATATQDVFTLKRSAGSSASVGVGPIGSISMPLGSTDDALVKVASETIPAGEFYERFFKLVEFYIDTEPPPMGSAGTIGSASPVGTQLPAPALPKSAKSAASAASMPSAPSTPSPGSAAAVAAPGVNQPTQSPATPATPASPESLLPPAAIH